MPLFDTISSLFTTSSLGAVFEVNAAAASSAQLTINSGGKRTSRRGSRRNRSARKSRSFGQESGDCGCNSNARKSLRKSMRKSIRKSVSCRKGKCSSARRSAIRRSLLKAVRSTSRKAAAIKAKKSASRQAKKSASRKAAKSATPCRQRKSPCAAKVSPCAAKVSPCAARKAVPPAASKKLAAVQQISAQSNGNIPADVRERIAARVQHHLENRKYSPEEASKRRLWCALQRGDCRAREVVVDIFKGANSCKPVVCKPCAPCQDRPCPKFAPCPTAAKCPPVQACAPCPTQNCPKEGPCPPCAPPPNCPPCALQNMFRGK